MVLGYNHNVSYKGEQFHVQTEDSGVKNPNIVTLLYRAGAILASKKTCYADILKIDSLEAVVEDLMKEQHKDMMRRLKNGEFDSKIFEAAFTAPSIEEQQAKNEAKTTKTNFQLPEVEQSTKPKTVEIKPVSLDDAILEFFGASK